MGYYRVNYDEATWQQLTSSLASLSNINTGGFLPHLAIPRFSYPNRWWIY